MSIIKKIIPEILSLSVGNNGDKKPQIFIKLLSSSMMGVVQNPKDFKDGCKKIRIALAEELGVNPNGVGCDMLEKDAPTFSGITIECTKQQIRDIFSKFQEPFLERLTGNKANAWVKRVEKLYEKKLERAGASSTKSKRGTIGR